MNGHNGPVTIQSVTVWNRRDCCEDRLFGAILELRDDDTDTVLASREITDAIGNTDLELSFEDEPGGRVDGVTSIRIHMPVKCNHIIQIAEVFAYGYVP